VAISVISHGAYRCKRRGVLAYWNFDTGIDLCGLNYELAKVTYNTSLTFIVTDKWLTLMYGFRT